MKSMSRHTAHFLKRGSPAALVFGLAAFAAVAVPASASASARDPQWPGTSTSTTTRPGRTRSAPSTGTPTARLPPNPGPRSRPAAPAPAPGSPPRARSRSRRTAGSCSPPTPAATRSRYCGSGPTARSAWCQAASSPPAALLPVSIAVHGSLVYVANAGTGGSNYTGFRLGRDGRLIRSPARPSRCPPPPQPGDVLFNGTGTKLVGTRVGTSQIDSFTVGFGGRLTAGPRIAVPGAGPRPVRQRVPADQPQPAVRVQRPQHRRRQRHRLGVHRLRERHADPDRGLPVRR